MRTPTFVPRVTLGVSLLLASCGDSSSPSAPDGGEPGNGGRSGSGSGGMRASGGDPSNGGTRSSVAGHDLVVTTGGDAFFARFESTGPSPFQQGPAKFKVSKLGVDGVFGSAVEPSTAPPDTLSAPAMAPRGDGFALVWVEGASLRFAAFDAAGAMVVPPKTLPSGPVDSLSDPHIARGSGTDFGVVYASASEGVEDADVLFLVLDGDGNAKGTSKLVQSLESTGFLPVTNVVTDGDGYALLYRDVQNQRGHVYFAARDASGEGRVAPKRLSTIDAQGVSSGVGADQQYHVSADPASGAFSCN